MSEERKENIQTGNPLGEASVVSLMVKFAVQVLSQCLSVPYITLLTSYLLDRLLAHLAMLQQCYLSAYHILVLLTCTDVWYWRCFLL